MLLLQCICIHSTDIGQCQNLYSHVVQYCSHSKSSPKEGRRNDFSQPWPKHFKFASYRHEMGVLTAHTDCCYYPVLWWHHKLLQYPCGVNQAQEDPAYESNCVYGYIISILCSSARASAAQLVKASD